MQQCKCAHEGEDNNTKMLFEDSTYKGSYGMTQSGEGSSNDFESGDNVVQRVEATLLHRRWREVTTVIR